MSGYTVIDKGLVVTGEQRTRAYGVGAEGERAIARAATAPHPDVVDVAYGAGARAAIVEGYSRAVTGLMSSSEADQYCPSPLPSAPGASASTSPLSPTSEARSKGRFGVRSITGIQLLDNAGKG